MGSEYWLDTEGIQYCKGYAAIYGMKTPIWQGLHRHYSLFLVMGWYGMSRTHGNFLDFEACGNNGHTRACIVYWQLMLGFFNALLFCRSYSVTQSQ
jgi:hypothetical protein